MRAYVGRTVCAARSRSSTISQAVVAPHGCFSQSWLLQLRSVVVIDSHCHLADEAFTEDIENVIARAQAAGVTDALCILAAENPTETARAQLLSVAWPRLRFSVGVHPHQAGSFEGRV